MITPCWWVIWPTKICSLGGSTFKPPHALWLTPFLVSSSTNYSRYQPQEHSFCHKKATQYSVVTPGAHVITEWKSTDTRRDRSVPNTFVHWCYVFVHVLSSGSGAEQERDRWKWSAWSRLGLVTSPGLSNVSWLFYYSWCKNLYPATIKQNRCKHSPAQESWTPWKASCLLPLHSNALNLLPYTVQVCTRDGA